MMWVKLCISYGRCYNEVNEVGRCCTTKNGWKVPLDGELATEIGKKVQKYDEALREKPNSTNNSEKSAIRSQLKAIDNMDENSIVHEIVKSLAFEIEAVNQDNVLKWTTTNGTPLNVKVRVRNKDEPRLVQRGAMPVPRIGITAPEKLRLISSDQTILSFNVYMEDDLTKQEDSKRRNGFRLFNIGGCLGTYSDDEGPYLPSSSKKNAIGSKTNSKSDSGILNDNVAQSMDDSNTVSQKQRGFLGKCKRGGCLDPPFGEDRYPYGLPKTNLQDKLEFEINELEENIQYKAGGCLDPQFSKDKCPYTPKKRINEEKLALKLDDNKSGHSINISSPKKNNKPSSEFRISVQKTKNEIDPKKLMDIYARASRENSLASKYSNSIITYPTDISSTETIFDQLPHKRKSVQSNDEDSQRQTCDYPQSYYVPPKDVLKYKEEESKYSRELSDDQIRKSSKNMISDTTDNLKLNEKNAENKPISQYLNKTKELVLTEPQLCNIDAIENKSVEKLNLNATPFITTASYLETHTSKVNDSKNSVPAQILGSNSTSSYKNSISKNNVESLENKNNSMETDDNRLIDSFPQDKFDTYNMHERIHPTIDLCSQNHTDNYSIRTNVDKETIQKELEGNTTSSHTEIDDECDVSDKIVESDSKLTIIPPQKDLIHENDSNKVQKVKTFDNQPISKIIQSIRSEVVPAISPTAHKAKDISTTEKLSLNLKDQVDVKDTEMKDNVDNLNEINPEFKSKAVKKLEKIQKEHGNISHDHSSSPENIEFDISSSNSMDSKQELSLKGYIKNQEDSLGHEKRQDLSSVNLDAANEGSVIIQNDLKRDKNIKTTPDSTNKIMNAILQKTPFITRNDSDIHNDEINKTIPLKRNTFTIIGSDTSLSKREEDEEITENISDVYLKSADKNKFNTSSHTYNKSHILDAQNKTSDTNTITLPLNNLQENGNDIHFKNTNKLMSLGESPENTETLDLKEKQEKNNLGTDINTSHTRDNITNISLSSNQTEASVGQIPENRIHPEEHFSQKPILTNVEDLSFPIPDNGNSMFTVRKPAGPTLIDSKKQKSKEIYYENAPVDSSQISVEEYVKEDINLTDNRKLNITDIHEKTQIPSDTKKDKASIMIKSDTYLKELLPITATNKNSRNYEDYNLNSLSLTEHKTSSATNTSAKHAPDNRSDIDSKITEKDNSYPTFHKLENSGTAKELLKTIYKDSSMANSPKHSKDNLYASDTKIYQSENNMHTTDIDLTQKSVTGKLYPEITEVNKSFLITQKSDETNTLFAKDKELENPNSKKADLLDYTTISRKPRTASKITDYDNIPSVVPINDKIGYLELDDNDIPDIDKSQKLAADNVANLYPALNDNENYNMSTQKEFKPELKEIIYTNADMDKTQQVGSQNEDELYFDITDNNIDNPISNGLEEQGGRYQQPENKVYINSDSQARQRFISGNEQPLDPDKSNEKSEPYVYKKIDNVIDKTKPIDHLQKNMPDNVRDSNTEIAEDGKFDFSGKTDDGTSNVGEETKQPQSERQNESELKLITPRYVNNIFHEPNVEITTLDKDTHHFLNGTKYQKPTTVEPSFYTDVKTDSIQNSLYDGPEFQERANTTGEVLSNISEHFEGDEKIIAQFAGHKDHIGKDEIFSELYTETNKVYENLENKSAGITKGTGSVVTTISIDMSDLDPKLLTSNFNVPRNTLVTSISTSKLGIDKNKNNRSIAEALESMKYVSRDYDQRTLDNSMKPSTSNIVNSGAPLAKIASVAGENEKYQWPELQLPANDFVEMLKNDLGRRGSPNISYDRVLKIHDQPALMTHKDMTLLSQQVLLESQNLTQIGVAKANLGITESVALQDKKPLYVNMSFYSYVNENNERIIQTHSPLIEQQRYDDGTVTVIKTLIRHGNQIRIPIDEDNDLALNIIDKVDTCNKDAVNVGSITSRIRRGKNEVERTPKRTAVLNKSLALIYESKLIPLHNAIKDLTQEVNTLTVKREMLQEKKRSAYRTKSLKLIPVKRCGCRRI